MDQRNMAGHKSGSEVRIIGWRVIHFEIPELYRALREMDQDQR